MFENLSFKNAAKKQKSKPSSSRHQPALSNDGDIFDKPAAAASDARIESGILKI